MLSCYDRWLHLLLKVPVLGFPSLMSPSLVSYQFLTWFQNKITTYEWASSSEAGWLLETALLTSATDWWSASAIVLPFTHWWSASAFVLPFTKCNWSSLEYLLKFWAPGSPHQISDLICLNGYHIGLLVKNYFAKEVGHCFFIQLQC